MSIPNITIDYFENEYIEYILDTLRISKDELITKLEDNGVSSINKKANRFITTYLKNRIEKLTDDNWLSAKELFIQWKLFEGIELENVSKDKKETLLELLELFKEEIIQLENQKIDGSRKVAKIIVFGGEK